MKLSTKTRYGTRALLDLALHHNEEPVVLRDIANRQQISLSYLEQLIAPLIAGGILRSVRGTGGGVALVKDINNIKMIEVVKLLQGSIAPTECVNNPEVCIRSSFCVTRDVWSELERAINKVLESTTLRDLVERQRQKRHSQEAIEYQI